MGCGSKCVKISLIMFNIFFWLLGLGILAVGIWIKVDQKVVNLSEAIQVGSNEPIVEIITWIFIGTGIFVFCVGFFGCCGAVRESKVLLGFYMTCIVIVFAAELGAGIYAAVRKEDIKVEISTNGAIWIREHYSNSDSVSQGLNYLQLEFCCCGVNDFRDYKDSKFVEEEDSLKNSGAYLSFACCRPEENVLKDTVSVSISAEDKTTCIAQAKTAARTAANTTSEIDLPKGKAHCEKIFRTKGCLSTVVDWADDHMLILIIVGIVIAVLQLFGFVLALCLCRMIGAEEKL